MSDIPDPDENPIEYYQHYLDVGAMVICEALGVSIEKYDRDQADGECYLDCFKDAAALLRRSGVTFDNVDTGDWVVPAEQQEQIGG